MEMVTFSVVVALGLFSWISGDGVTLHWSARMGIASSEMTVVILNFVSSVTTLS